MTSARKLRAAREREKRKEEEKRQADKLEKNWKRIKQMTLGLSRDSDVDRVARPLRTKVFRRETTDAPSLITTARFESVAAKPRYTGKMLERERAAQVEIDRKKSQVAVPYNKGAYQFVTPGMDPKTFGRK